MGSPAKKSFRRFNVILLSSFVVYSKVWAEPAKTVPLGEPQAPLIIRPVHEVDVERLPDGSIKHESPQYYRTIRPTIPPVRTSHDGRIGFNWTNRFLYLLAPEKLNQPFPFSDSGLNILVDLNGIHSQVEAILTKPSDQGRPGYFEGPALCNSSSMDSQPRVCNGSNECYDLSYIGFRVFSSPGNSKGSYDQAFLRSRKIEIEIANPKTSNARIIAIRPMGEVSEKVDPVEVDFNLSQENFHSFEPMTVADGRLFVARAGYNPIKNIDGPGNSGQKNVDIYYMVAPKNAAPCEASAFSGLRRIQRAYQDPDMRDPETQRTRYGIAEYQMKDSFGNPIPDDGLFPLYPWIDHNGNNIMFSTGGGRLFSYDYSSPDNFHSVPVAEPERQGNLREWKMNKNSARYPARCLAEASNCEDSPYNPEIPDGVRGFAILGSWTHGKTIVLDGMINSSDYGLRRGLQFQRELKLYQPAGSFDGWVRIGPGRDTGGGGSGMNNNIESYSENSEIRGMSVLTGVIDSLENKFNAYRNLRPTMPRDIVWTINNSIGSDEVPLDDYMDPRALIISTMIAGAQYERYGDRNDGWRYRDGFGWGGSFQAPEKPVSAILIQNAATSEKFKLPPYGYLNKGRVEPVALGGIHGRGLWLDGSTLVYTFPQAILNSPLFLSLFVDSRPVNANPKKILTFPDGTGVFLTSKGLRINKTFANGGSAVTQTFPEILAERQWTQLGISVSQDGKQIDIYINGMKKYSASFKQKLFQLKTQNGKGPINLVVGANQSSAQKGFRGWIDDLKLLAYIPVPEVICNQAYGSLHYVRPEAAKYWQDKALSYPRFTHQEIFGSLPANFASEKGISAKSLFACTTDYADPMGIYRSLMREGENLISLREVLLFAVPESGGQGVVDGRLHWNHPRVDFKGSAFCLSCHTTEERRGLHLSALEAGTRCAMRDRRRQPLQPPPFLTGLISSTQLSLIDPDFGNKEKIYQPSGALMVDPFVQAILPGGGCP